MKLVVFIGASVIVGACIYNYLRGVNSKAKNTTSCQPETPKPKPQVATSIAPVKDEPRKKFNQVAAKNACLNNIDRFAPLLHSLVDGTYSQPSIQAQWNDLIVDINNQDLIDMWHLMRKSDSTIKQVLAQWGLTSDTCTNFDCMDFHKSIYATESGQSLMTGKHYTVLSPCWILTSNSDNGAAQKIVVKKGIVK